MKIHCSHTESSGSPLPLLDRALISTGRSPADGLGATPCGVSPYCSASSFFLHPPRLRALGQTYSIDWYKITGGGGASTGDTYSVSGSNSITLTSPTVNLFFRLHQ